MSQLLFPLPYDGSPQHNESWERAEAFKGRRVKVVTEKGETVCGIVERTEVSCSSDRSRNGVGFMLRCGGERFPWSVPVNAGLQSIQLEASA
jgi:hypothetical protein